MRFYKIVILLFLSGTSFAQSIYDGGIGDGYSTSCYSQTDNLAYNIYSGGLSDGFTLNCYTQADNIAYQIYSGGTSDGFTFNCYTQADNIAYKIYSGGVSDGYSMDCYTQLDNVFYHIYSGGIGDGFAANCLGMPEEVPLPIKLITFNAILLNKQVYLKWQTASETNNDFFTIERSKNGRDWGKIALIEGAGNSTQLLQYNFIDMHPYSNISFYRLKQTDFNGKFTYSKIKLININSLKAEVVLFPNPTNGQLTIRGQSEELSFLKVYNILGQDVSNLVEIVNRNETMIVIDLNKLPQGTYIIKTRTTVNKIYKTLNDN